MLEHHAEHLDPAPATLVDELRVVEVRALVPGSQLREAKGYSRQKGYLDRYVGSEYSLAYLPKVEINVWVNDAQAQAVADRIARSARTKE